MPELTEMFVQLPVAGIVLLVVWKFLHVIKERDANWLDSIRNRDDKFISELKNYEALSHEMQREMIASFKENSAVIAQCSHVLGQVERRLNIDDRRQADDDRRRVENG